MNTKADIVAKAIWDGLEAHSDVAGYIYREFGVIDTRGVDMDLVAEFVLGRLGIADPAPDLEVAWATGTVGDVKVGDYHPNPWKMSEGDDEPDLVRVTDTESFGHERRIWFGDMSIRLPMDHPFRIGVAK